MRKMLLTSTALILASTDPTFAEPLPQADMAAILAAIDAGDGKSLVDSLYGKSFDLTAEQNEKAGDILESYIAGIPGTLETERNRAKVAIITTNFDRIGISNDESQKTLSALIQSIEAAARTGAPAGGATFTLPAALADALAANDAPAAIAYLLTNGSGALNLDKHGHQLIKLITSYAKPLPAANTKANKEAYKALAILEPDNTVYAQKAKAYEDAEKEARLGAVNKLKKRVDDFNGYTFYTSPAKPKYADTRSYLLPYLAVKGQSVVLRIELHYTADSWLFIRRASLGSGLVLAS